MMSAKFEVYINGIYWWTFEDYSEAWSKCKKSYELTQVPCKLVTKWK